MDGANLCKVAFFYYKDILGLKHSYAFYFASLSNFLGDSAKAKKNSINGLSRSKVDQVAELSKGSWLDIQRLEPLVDVVVCRIVDLMESKKTWTGLGLQPKLQVNMLRILRFLLKSLGGCLEEEVARDHNVELDMVDLEQLLNDDVSDVARRGIDVFDDATQGNSCWSKPKDQS
ncbi:hypothetical protein V6N12_058160 [Hibiscus sabdariffa]|uniref:Uncharacterized protein n=1 Tax=Hibiscus sabdariffa TaxID=183260 RepID=A0ABR1ZNE2_9ROSI